MTGSLLRDAFAHHVWATLRLIDACTGLSPAQLATSVPGTYGSILETLRHLVQSDSWYLSFFTDRVPPSDEDASRMGLDEARSLIEINGGEWMSLLDHDPDADRDIVEEDGEWRVESPVGVRLAQVIHHGTDHRSQVCTALTFLGVEPPEIDVWAYARETGRERAQRIAHHPTPPGAGA